MPTWMQSVYYVNVYMCVHCTYIHVCITHITYVFHTCILVYVYCIPARWKHAVCDQMHQMDQKAGSTARHQTPGSTRNTVFKSETFSSSFLCIVNQEQHAQLSMWQLLENIFSVKAFFFAKDPTFSALRKINEDRNYLHTSDCLQIV